LFWLHQCHDSGDLQLIPQDEAYRLRYLLTDVQRSLEMTKALSKERGKPFYLAARVAGSLEMCRGAYRNDRIGGDVPVVLKQTLTGAGPTVTLDIADNLLTDAPVRVELRVRLDQWMQGDVVQVRWDGRQMEHAEIRYCTVHDPHQISDVSSAAWLCFAVAPAEVEQGPHEVNVALVERHPQLACDMVLTDVELVIIYRE